MLDIKRIRMNFDEVKKAISKRKGNFPLEEALKLDEDRRNIIAKVEDMKSEQNKISKQIPMLKKEGKPTEEIFENMRALSDEIKSLDDEQRIIEEKLREILLEIPNTPHESVPVGADDSENVELLKFGTPREFDFKPKAHWDLGTDLNYLDFERANKITGSRFSIYRGEGATLLRALTQFMLDLHIHKHGYTEMSLPVVVNRDSMTGTGQLPKFEEDMYHINKDDLFLIPTAEVPLTNYFRDEILDGDDLTISITAYTPCFRREAGSAGRDTRGLIRNHQFDKVELVKFTKPEDSYNELEKLRGNAEEILQLLNLPYRVVTLCSGDLGFSAAKTFDIEVWMPSYGRYVEISSCSNFEDFQARRSNIRFRREKGAKPELVHTLNGSGLAVGRCYAAVLENFQRADGTIEIPEVLKPYMSKKQF